MKNICDWNNCNKIGEYKAPLEKDNSKKYRMLCLEHVKEFTVPFYIGSESTIRGYGELEVNCNTETEITDVAMLSVVN